jgi:hypothetical protein
MRELAILFTLFLSCSAASGQTEYKLSIIVSGPASFHGTDLRCSIAGKSAAITAIEPQRDRTLHYVLLNDQSGSGQSNWPKGVAEQAAYEDAFLNSIVKKNMDVGTLINFNDETYIDVMNEKDPSVLSSKIERRGRGGSATYDAIVKSTSWFSKQPDIPNSRKVLFLFTDGDEDNASHLSSRKAIEELQKNSISLFVFLPASATGKKKSLAVYELLATSSGGRVYSVPTDQIGTSVFGALQADLANGFIITLALPPDVGPGIKPVKITSEQNLDLHISATTDLYLTKK